ncbi:MAG: type II toxin-antitoxin system RelE/ParE family toxin [Deltaproteobacteria bacterium]|jgi:toxin ParE1/3/4|nr:type II toxin-antitoxin system RelE/ParE family toxin [Deltaproteobacteria bacterium]
MAAFEVLVSEEAENDLDSIYDFIALADGVEQAVRIQDRLMEEILSLETLPARGKCPPEMLALGVTEYREVQCAPWRIFYYIGRNRVGVAAVLDGRRNVGVLLQQRLL